MNKVITDTTVTIATYDDAGNLVRTESRNWDTEESEELNVSQQQIQDAVESLCEFFDTPTVPTKETKETKEKKKQ